MGIYPAVDVSSSISRVMNDLVSSEHANASKIFRKHITNYVENKDLLLMGGYTQGQDKDIDDAITMWPKIINFITQPHNQKADYESSISQLLTLYNQECELLKKIKRFQRLATLRKRDMSKEISNSNLLEKEIVKNQNLINQINLIMENGKVENDKELVSAGYLKNNLQLLSTLQSQKNIANNRQNYLLSEKKIIQSKIIVNNIKKIKAEEKSYEYKKNYNQELENKNI